MENISYTGNSHGWFSPSDFQLYLKRFFAEAPGPLEQKYVVVFWVENEPYVYPMSAPEVDWAIAAAFSQHHYNAYPLPADTVVQVYAACTGANCGCCGEPIVVYEAMPFGQAA